MSACLIVEGMRHQHAQRHKGVCDHRPAPVWGKHRYAGPVQPQQCVLKLLDLILMSKVFVFQLVSGVRYSFLF